MKTLLLIFFCNTLTIYAQFGHPKSKVCSMTSIPVMKTSTFDRIERSQNDRFVETKINNHSSERLIESIGDCYFHSYHKDFLNLFPKKPVVLRLPFKSFPFAHEATVYIPSTDELFFTSNILHDERNNEFIKIFLMDIQSTRIRELGYMNVSLPNVSSMSSNIIPMANGAFKDRFDPYILYVCSQGYGETGGSIYKIDIRWSISQNSHKPLIVLDNYFGLPFNSPNDIIQDSHGSIWFTDPSYGFAQGFRDNPKIGSYVWWFDQKSTFSNQAIKAVITDLIKPNGLAFNENESILYVTDSGYSPSNDVEKPHELYAFDVEWSPFGPNLRNKRLFAVVDSGIPDGLKLDRNGNLYVGCGDGVQIFNQYGLLLGKIVVDRGFKVSNLAFGGQNMQDLYMMGENTIYLVNMAIQGI